MGGRGLRGRPLEILSNILLDILCLLGMNGIQILINRQDQGIVSKITLMKITEEDYFILITVRGKRAARSLHPNIAQSYCVKFIACVPDP